VGRLHAGLERDERLGALAPALVGDRDHRALHDGGVTRHRLLDLDRRDVLAAGDDDVLLTIAQLDVAVRMPHRDVAGVKPSAPKCLGSGVGLHRAARSDRKSTRLNSSHEWISYAVFRLKKKTR